MEPKLLLVKTITLLYLNGKLSEKNDEAIKIAQDVLEMVKPKDKLMSSEFGTTDPTNELRDTLIYMISQGSGYEFDENELSQRYKVNTSKDETTYDALVSSFLSGDESQEKIHKTFNNQKNAILTHINKTKLANVLKNFYVKTSFHPEEVNYKTIVTEIQQALQPFQNIQAGDEIMSHSAIVSNVDLGNKESIREVFQKAADELSEKGVIKTPYQGLNRMMGSHGGIRRGEMCCITALTHNYKTGITLDIFMGCALFNTPYMRDPTKKPLNLRLTFENTVQQDFAHMYKKLKEADGHSIVNLRDVDPEEAAKYVLDRLSINGYQNQIIHMNPSDVNYTDIFKIIESFEKKGYEVHLLTIDYLNMINRQGLQQGPTGEEIRDLFRRMRNFCLKRGIAVVTPHQFSSEARKVERGEPKNFVKTVTSKGFYDGCSRLEQELDLEISIHIVEFNGESYLTMHRGKHRGVVTPVRDRYTVYKFEEIGGLPMDIEGEDQSRKSIGAETQAQGGGTPWFENII